MTTLCARSEQRAQRQGCGRPFINEALHSHPLLAPQGRRVLRRRLPSRKMHQQQVHVRKAEVRNVRARCTKGLLFCEAARHLQRGTCRAGLDPSLGSQSARWKMGSAPRHDTTRQAVLPGCADTEATAIESQTAGDDRELCGSGDPPPRDALEGKGPQRRPQRRLGRQLQEVAEAVGGGYCRLQMPLRLALGVREPVAGHRLAPWRALGGGGVTSPPSNASLPPPPPLVLTPGSGLRDKSAETRARVRQ